MPNEKGWHMIKTNLLCTVASAAFFVVATCAVANASSFDSDIGTPSGSQVDQGLQNGLERDSSADNPSALTDTGGDLTLQDFVIADKNSDGYLNHDEFKALGAIVRKDGDGPDALAKVRKFSADDTNHDGKISAEELGLLGGGAG
jgi:hypothetical protein